MGKLEVEAKTRDATAETAKASNNVRLRPHDFESAKEPPKKRPTTPEMEPLPKPIPTIVADKPT